MAIPTSVRYWGDGRSMAWEVPFPFSDDRQVAVAIVDSTGGQRRLRQGVDYLLVNRAVYSVVPVGGQLVIWLDASLDAAMSAPQAAVLPEMLAASVGDTVQASVQAGGIGNTPQACAQASAGVNTPQSGDNVQISSQSANVVNTLQSEAGSQSVGPVYASGQAEAVDVQAITADLRAQIQNFADRVMESMANTLQQLTANAVASLQACAADTASGIQKSAKTQLGQLPQQCHIQLQHNISAGAFLELELVYLAGTHTLAVYHNGVLLTPSMDYEECGLDNEAASHIRLLKPLNSGDTILATVYPITAPAAAEASALAAAESQRAAASILLSTQNAASQLADARAISDNAAITAQGWANASQKSANEAYTASCDAWQAAAQVSVHARRPGICAVHAKEDIHACSPGLFIINPHLTHAPTPFFGVWPAASVDDMAWDAVFFLHGCPYPDDPALPAFKPCKPQPDPVAASGEADQWIPCNHHEPVAGCDCCVKVE